MIIDDFSSILRGEHKVIEHIHFVCDKLCAFCAIFCSFRFTIGLNTFIVSRLEIFCITFNAHPHSGWFICLAPTERDRLKSLIISENTVERLCFLISSVVKISFRQDSEPQAVSSDFRPLG